MNHIKFIIGFLLCSFFVAFAQNDQQKALSILDAMSKKYKELSSFKAKFTYSMENQATGSKETAKGEITVKGTKFYLKMANQEIYNNGSTVWTYMKDANEVNITNNDPDEDELNPTKIYTLYKKGYKYRFLEDKLINGAAHEIVELNPEDTKKKFFKVKIEINKKDRTVRSWQIFEKNGNRFTYLVEQFTPNIAVTDANFNFDKAKYPGVSVEELR
jgi:outer membrane lipoprotein carrier protein